MKDLFGNESAQPVVGYAHFSRDRRYRYVLYREWDKNKPKVMFIGLNPSTADETDDDPTIRKVIDFAKGWGYGGVYMTNLFGIVSSDPDILLTDPDPLGENDTWLEDTSGKCQRIIFAWGAFKQARTRAEEVKKRFPDAYCLKKTKGGHPWHPLYVKGDTQPIKY